MAKKKVSKARRDVDTLIRRVERNRRAERERDFDPRLAHHEMGECDFEVRSGTDRLFDKIEAVETFVKDLRQEVGNVRGHQNRKDELKNELEEFEFSGKSVFEDAHRRDRRRDGDRERRSDRRRA